MRPRQHCWGIKIRYEVCFLNSHRLTCCLLSWIKFYGDICHQTSPFCFIYQMVFFFQYQQFHQENCSSQPVCISRAEYRPLKHLCFNISVFFVCVFVSFPKSRMQQWWGSRKRDIETETEECGVKNPQIHVSLTSSLWLLGENERDKEGH